MNIPIKFRAKTLKGEFVFGDFISRGPEAGRPGIIDEQDFYHEVDPDTVVQLVGYDEDENEVYEGDILTDDRGNIWFAKTRAYAIYESHCEDITRELNEVRLKENQQ